MMMKTTTRLLTLSILTLSLTACAKYSGQSPEFFKPQSYSTQSQSPAYVYGQSFDYQPGQSMTMAPTQMRGPSQPAQQASYPIMEQYAGQATYASPLPHMPQNVPPIPQMSVVPNVVQAPASNKVNWYEALSFMYRGQVESAMQTHTGEVVLYMRSGERISTQSPQLDDIVRVKQACGVACSSMMIATQ